MKRRRHWEGVFGSKEATELSWYQAVPTASLRLIEASGVSQQDTIIDVGGGASTLVDSLLGAGFENVTVLDISENALQLSRHRLGVQAGLVNWVVSDVTAFEPAWEYSLWHDRAVFHFLIDAGDRASYIDVLRRALLPGGSLILATFGPEGPLRCSGLEIQRYTTEMLVELLGADFELRHHELEDHQTPAGSTQQFLYSCWTRRE